MKPVIDYSLYLVTDRHYLKGRDFYACLEEALKGGITLVQLREKMADEAEFVAIGKKVLALCQKYHVPLLVNDNLPVAKKIGAAGVHLGQDDLNMTEARRLLGPDAIIGISAHNVEEALLAEQQGADYLGVGAMYPTGSKDDVNVIGPQALSKIVAAVKIPVVGIGGIGLKTYNDVRKAGAVGCAMISCILGADDITGTVRALHNDLSK